MSIPQKWKKRRGNGSHKKERKERKKNYDNLQRLNVEWDYENEKASEPNGNEDWRNEGMKAKGRGISEKVVIGSAILWNIRKITKKKK